MTKRAADARVAVATTVTAAILKAMAKPSMQNTLRRFW